MNFSKYSFDEHEVSEMELSYINIEKLEFVSESYSQNEVYDLLTNYRFSKFPIQYIISKILIKFDKPSNFLHINYDLNKNVILHYKYKDFNIYKISFLIDGSSIDCIFELVNNPFYKKSLDILENRNFIRSSQVKHISKAKQEYIHKKIDCVYIDGLLTSFKKLIIDFEWKMFC